MADKKVGLQTVVFKSPIFITSAATVVGRTEGEGPLGNEFDVIKPDNMMGQKSFEKAEASMLEECVRLALSNGTLQPQDIDFFFAGDLLNQLVTTNYAARELSMPFLGLYGACSTFCLGLLLSSIVLEAGCASKVLAAACSHHDTAERQYRYPTEFGGQRPPSAQWTVTGAGAAVLQNTGTGPRITHATVGSVYDLGVKDANNMGAAMAPAAAETISRHLADTKRDGAYYDMVVTGDLGHVGQQILDELLQQKGVQLAPGRLHDCGVMIFNKEQDTHAGGSGCGCSAVVFLGHLLKRMQQGQITKLLLVATGALHSPCTLQQGESIPGIAHAVAFEV